MSTFSIAEATNHLSRLIDLALKGEHVTIARDGVAVVELRPTHAAPPVINAEALARLRQAREGLGTHPGDAPDDFLSHLRDAEWNGR